MQYVRRYLTKWPVLICYQASHERDMKPQNLALELHVTIVPVATMKRLIFAAAICAATFGGSSVPSNAADLVPGAQHVRTSWGYLSWRDRCAWAGHYCLYAWHGYVYHYPWDDRAYAYAYYPRRHRY